MRTTPTHWVSGSRRPHGPDTVYALIAAAALGMGILVYLFARPPIELLPFSWHFRPGPWSGSLTGVLPEFLHVFAFILLTAAVVRRPPRPVSICAFWLGTETLFEVGQHPLLAPYMAETLPTWLGQLPILSRTANYFLQGTFDPWDFVAIALGTLAAYAVIKRAEGWR